MTIEAIADLAEHVRAFNAANPPELHFTHTHVVWLASFCALRSESEFTLASRQNWVEHAESSNDQWVKDRNDPEVTREFFARL